MRKTVAFLFLIASSLLAGTALAAPSYPIPADEFQETIDRKIEATWEKIEKKLDKQKVSDERKEAIRRVFDEAAEGVKEALEKASEDGNISRNEAYKINVMTSGLRGKMRGKLAVERAENARQEQKAARTTRPAPERKAAKTPEGDTELDSKTDTDKPAPKAAKGRPAKATKKAKRS